MELERPPMTTAEATKYVLDRLRYGGNTVARANAGGRKGGVQLLPAGWPDVIGFARNGGFFIGIEVKARKEDKLRAAQATFRFRIREAGGLWHEFRDPDRFNAWCADNDL